MPQMNANLNHQFNTNISRVQPTPIRVFDNNASKIPGIVKLTLGEPDFNVPDVAKKAAIQSINDNDSHYSAGSGTPQLRQAIANYLQNRYDLTYDADSEIAVTIGATEAIYASLFAIINKGDQVLIPTPTFPLYEAIVNLLGGEAINIDTSDNDFVLSPDALKKALADHDHVKAIVLNYPSNPTGVTYSADQLKAIADVLADTDLVVIADEIYSELIYGGHHTSIAKFIPGQTIVLNGASKSGAMTGYRIGFMAAPAELMKRIGMVHSIMITSPSDPAMAAAVPIFDSDDGHQATLDMKAAYEARRDFLVAALQKLDFTVTTPRGAFYVFAKIPADQGTDDVKFATKLAQEGKVAVIPGSYFGDGGEGYLRLSYATSMDNLKLAVDRIKDLLNK
ncbi:MAG: aminotransferase class I/II-fold pyridoxal phosphate-dependent enzyme [Limosilactobacillus coleohominis]|uniref:aminotransferase class I/II-fold pyridoxal phosphate-dependent enzyme n=1 Tax=Limosilactobacillus coleohominis TaxID=181675 RepID=UPI002A80263E|nr:aminotransferase class I/II-fold pyridoxal phosphate-dependent enzyme [Limosilactobacillus coleohominis]MCI5812653.1 aminotransferase class I/II-fold pyridoxal phosphate-dependent enzyme [Lactobacillus sp.]MDY3702964.1 aminotransferase class I/II-fold pyridoxal phosphate-dependent enzyme [Limosilactobacillus coleohominis]MDY5629418.1 aminotransferase class I/II-fold pyridoxal phosphate-dependent enzyme [Limosilactobacillus coleohominis]